MTTLHFVTTLDVPELAPYRTLRRPEEHWKRGIFVAEGGRLVRRLLGSGLTVHSMLLTREWHEQLRKATEGQRWSDDLQLFIAEKKLLETIVGFPLHQGVMAVAAVPAEPLLVDILRAASRPMLLVALDGIASAENVGVIVRNSAAFGADGILVNANSGSPFLRRAVRSSMGGVFQLPVLHTVSLHDTLLSIKNAQGGVEVIAAHPGGQTELHGSDLSGDLCLVFGSEGEGITPEVLAVSDRQVAIPMMKGTDSLNVASSSAVFLYEARKQRIRR